MRPLIVPLVAGQMMLEAWQPIACVDSDPWSRQQRLAAQIVGG